VWRAQARSLLAPWLESSELSILEFLPRDRDGTCRSRWDVVPSTVALEIRRLPGSRQRYSGSRVARISDAVF
jgi:hypothetical protein